MKKILQPLFSILLILPVFEGQAAVFKEGQDYHVIAPVQNTSSGDKIEVTELFWYGCPHCHKFEPYIEKWLSTVNNDIEFIQMPAIFSDRWELLARAYYAADILGIREKIHRPLFDAIHIKKKRLTRKTHVVDFFADYGVNEAQFDKAYRSFAVENKVRFAKKMSRSYQVTGTPSLIINGKYRVEPGKGIGFKKMLEITNFLIEKERKASR